MSMQAHAIVSCDVGGLEMATLAQVLWSNYGLRGLAKKLNTPKFDIHSDFGRLLLGITYEEFRRRLEAGDPEAKYARGCAKVANFGFPGGMSAATLVHFALQSYQLKITEEFARKLKQIWQQANPDIAVYLQAIRKYQNPKTKRYDFQIPGTDLIRVGATYCSCANGQFQGLGAAMVKRIARKITEESYTDRGSPLWGTRPINFIHDEVLQQMLVAQLTAGGARMSEIFRGTFPEFCPDVNMSTEDVAMWYWSKDAARRERGGELVPWPLPLDVYDMAVRAAQPLDSKTKKKMQPEGTAAEFAARKLDAEREWWETGKMQIHERGDRAKFAASVKKHARVLTEIQEHPEWYPEAA